MDARQPNSNRKRQDENANSPPPESKNQRLAANSQPPLKILDVIDDCKERIFGHLNLNELFNVAVANEYLRPVVCTVYKRKFGMIQVSIKNDPSLPLPSIFGAKIYVDGLKQCLQYLRCLSPSISNLSIRYGGPNKKQYDYMHQYISKYCAESLVTIEIWDKPIGIQIKHFDKPFVNVHTVKIIRSDWDKQFSSFLQLFPNMRVLELNRVHIHTFHAIDSPFPYLEDLCIELSKNGRSFTHDLIAHLLQLCSQLRSLNIRMVEGNEMTLKSLSSLSSIIKDSPNICNLNVHNYGYPLVLSQSDIQQLVDEHPSMIEIHLIGFQFTVDAVLTVIHQLTSLKQFHFQLTDQSDYDRIVSQLDNQWQPSLKKEKWSGEKFVSLQR